MVSLDDSVEFTRRGLWVGKGLRVVARLLAADDNGLAPPPESSARFSSELFFSGRAGMHRKRLTMAADSSDPWNVLAMEARRSGASKTMRSQVQLGNEVPGHERLGKRLNPGGEFAVGTGSIVYGATFGHRDAHPDHFQWRSAGIDDPGYRSHEAILSRAGQAVALRR